MDNLTRRSFLVRGSVGAAGLAAAGAVIGKVGSGAGEDVHAGKDDHTGLSDHELAAANDPMIVEIRDAKRGHVTVMVRDKQVTFTDRALVAKALRATR